MELWDETETPTHKIIIVNVKLKLHYSMISFVNIHTVTFRETNLLKFFISENLGQKIEPSVTKYHNLDCNIVDDNTAYSRRCLLTFQRFC